MLNQCLGVKQHLWKVFLLRFSSFCPFSYQNKIEYFKKVKRRISTSKWSLQHLFTGRNTQQFYFFVSVIAFLVLSILSACLCFPMVMISSIGAAQSEYSHGNYRTNGNILSDNQTVQDSINTNALLRCEYERLKQIKLGRITWPAIANCQKLADAPITLVWIGGKYMVGTQLVPDLSYLKINVFALIFAK